MSLAVTVLTLNCGRTQVDGPLFAAQLADVAQDADLIFLSLQEIAPIAQSFLGGSFLDPYYDAFSAALAIAHPGEYVLVLKHNVGMTASMLFARASIASDIYNVTYGGTGVGYAQMGNKGAAATRIDYAEPGQTPVRLTFVAAHLAPHEYNVKRRNDDWENIVQKTVFQPATTSAVTQKLDVPEDTDGADSDETQSLLGGGALQGIYVPNTHLFVAGDMNYRTSTRAPEAGDQMLYPKPESSSTSKRHYSELLKTDQLSIEREAGRTLQGLTEAKIEFAPTYKFSQSGRSDDGDGTSTESNGTEYNWAPWRWPSWCDRVLYSASPSWLSTKTALRPKTYTSLGLLPSTDHKGVALRLLVPTDAIPFPSSSVRSSSTDPRIHPPFPIDHTWQASRASARNLEIIVGIGAWLGLTRAGRTALLSIVLAIWASYYLLASNR